MEKLGRNEPCWCGSGKKYKKCHEEFDNKIEEFEVRDTKFQTIALLKHRLRLKLSRKAVR